MRLSSSVSRAARTASVGLRLPLYPMFRRYGWPTLSPLFMSFVVTDRCNSLCKTCNIGARYVADPSVADGELSLEEYDRLFRTIGRLSWVTMSGGEPFMRRDFPEIVAALARHTRPSVVNVPTNATLVEATARGVSRILDALGDARLVVNLSVDGVGARHDEVRGFRNNFQRLEETARRLRALGDPRLVLGANTVISRFNVEDVDRTVDWVLGELRPDSYVLEPAQIRPEYYNEDETLDAERDDVAAVLDRVIARLSTERRSGVARVVKAFRLRYYQEARRALRGPRPHRCYSAFLTCTVMPHGDVWSNTQRADEMGNVRAHGYDFPALWRSAEARRARARVRRARCECESSNASYANALMDAGALGRALVNYVRYP